MSELTLCNYCSLQDIKRRAKEKGKKVTLLDATFADLGGQDVFVHPKDVSMKGANEKKRRKYFVAWFMELSERCCC